MPVPIGLPLLEKACFIDDQNRIIGRQVLDDIIPHKVTQRIRIPTATAQQGLLTPGARIASCFRAHPPGLAPLVPQQPVEEQVCRRGYARLRE